MAKRIPLSASTRIMETGVAGLLLPALVAALAAFSPARAEEGGLDRQKLTVRAFVDFGHLVNGYNFRDPDQTYKVAWLPLNRANVLAIQEMGVGSFDVSVGLSGLIWWPYGGGKSADLTDKVMQVKPMVPVARARWQFGDAAGGGTSGSLQVGTFNYKYNPDARNLGEYLYRSGTYPGILWTGEGWLLMNRAGNYGHGALLTVAQAGGALRHNLSLFMETAYHPVGDFSPGYDLGFTSKWVDLGAGAVFNHYLPLRPSQLTPKDASNTYAVITGRNAAGADTVVRGRLDQVTAPATPVDTVLDYWTFKGIKLMGRAALNLGHLLPPDSRGPEDLRLFVEAAVLGWENQPLYYEKRSERIPVMFGINLPTFKLLDVLSVQGEIYKSPYSDAFKFVQESKPIPETSAPPSKLAPPEHRDDFKWSIYGKKTVNSLLSVYAQAASDHLRLTDSKYNPSSIPLTNSWKKEWYYVLRLEYNLR